MRFLIFLLTLFTFSAFANYPDLKAYTQLKPLGDKPAFGPIGYAKAGNLYHSPVSNAGRFAMATFKTNSPATLAKQLLRKNPYAMLGLTALAFFQNDDDEWYKQSEQSGSIPNELIKNPKATTSHKAYSNHDVNTHFFAETKNEAVLLACVHFTTNIVDNVDSETLKQSYTCIDNGYSYQRDRQKSYVFGHDRYWYPPEVDVRPFLHTVTLQDEYLSCPPDSFPNHIIPHGSPMKCIEPSVNQQYTPQPTTAVQMASALSNHMNNNPDTVQDFLPFKERATDEFLSPDSIDTVNQPNVSDQFNEYLKSVSSGNHQSSSPDLPNYVPAEFVQPTQAAIKATEQGEPLVDPTTDDIINPDITQPDPTPTPITTPNPNLPYEITVNVPEDDTISQTEYEQSNAKFFEDFKAAADPSTQEIETLLKTSADGDKDFIDSLTTDVTNADIPALPLISDLWPNVNTGQCIPFTLNVSLRNQPKTITFDKHCPPYNTYVNPILTYFLYIITALYVLHLAGRTFARTVS